MRPRDFSVQFFTGFVSQNLGFHHRAGSISRASRFDQAEAPGSITGASQFHQASFTGTFNLKSKTQSLALNLNREPKTQIQNPKSKIQKTPSSIQNPKSKI